MPWSNGRGTTLELAVSPAGAAIGEIDWRISIATVSEPGPFSRLPGIDRVLLMLDDVEAELAIGGRTVALRRLDQVEFAGEDDVALLSASAPARDLNLMTRRGRVTGRMRATTAAAVPDRRAQAQAWLLAVAGPVTVTDGDETAVLDPLDLVQLGPGARVSGSGEVVLLETEPPERVPTAP